MILVFEPEPSPLMRRFVGTLTSESPRLLRPWRLPMSLQPLAPAALTRFATQRCVPEGRLLPGFALAELATSAWAGSRSDRRLHTRFVLRRLLAHWASRQRVVASATMVIAPSCAARALFAAAPRAKKILLLDMPGLRTLHEDLDSAAGDHTDAVYLQRYRAPDWALVNQEVEWRLADEIHVRGRFARDILLAHGIANSKIFDVQAEREQSLLRRERSDTGEVRVLLAGLASARHGTHQLLSTLEARPWLRVYARSGEGCEPAAFVQHPRVFQATQESLSEVDAVVVPSLCETYLPELRHAAASGVPVIATLRGAGSLRPDELFSELSPRLAASLPLAIDQLRAATLREHRQRTS